MYKKGLEYIDWIISFSLFIIAVMMIITFLRPGITPEFESQDLIDAVETNFFEENTWSSISVPIAVKKIYDSSIIIEAIQQPPNKWEFVDYYSPQNLTVLNVKVNINSNSVKISCISSPQCKTETSSSDFFQGIYITSMENLPNTTIKDFNFSVACIPGNTTLCDYLIGAKEIFTGLKESNLIALASNATDLYSQKKNAWRFPASRDFAVSYDYLNGSSQIDLLKPSYPAPEQLSIFVKEIPGALLNQNASKAPVKINIKVW